MSGELIREASGTGDLPICPGATVLVVQPGEKLVFVTTRTDYSTAEVDRALVKLRSAFPGNEVGIVCGFDQVIKQEAADDR